MQQCSKATVLKPIRQHLKNACKSRSITFDSVMLLLWICNNKDGFYFFFSFRKKVTRAVKVNPHRPAKFSVLLRRWWMGYLLLVVCIKIYIRWWIHIHIEKLYSLKSKKNLLVELFGTKEWWCLLQGSTAKGHRKIAFSWLVFS